MRRTPLALVTWASATLLPQERLLSARPLIVESPNFATAEECAGVLSLLERCQSGEMGELCVAARSQLVARDAALSRASRGSRGLARNSTSFQLAVGADLDPALDALIQRVHVMSRLPLEFGEGVQVASYDAGNYYEFHHDGQGRRATVILYLTDVPEGDGGETIFPLVRAPHIDANAEPPLPPAISGYSRSALDDFNLEHQEPMAEYCNSDFYLKVRPQVGKAVLFFNYGPDRMLDRFAFHGACPLHRGRKAVFQRWMRFDANRQFADASEAVRDGRLRWGLDRALEPRALPVPTTTTTSQDGQNPAKKPRELSAERMLELLNRRQSAPHKTTGNFESLHHEL